MAQAVVEEAPLLCRRSATLKSVSYGELLVLVLGGARLRSTTGSWDAMSSVDCKRTMCSTRMLDSIEPSGGLLVGTCRATDIPLLDAGCRYVFSSPLFRAVRLVGQVRSIMVEYWKVDKLEGEKALGSLDICAVEMSGEGELLNFDTIFGQCRRSWHLKGRRTKMVWSVFVVQFEGSLTGALEEVE